MKQLFGNIRMTWIKVILFAIIAGAYTGLVMMVPFFKGTSFQDIGIAYEWWVIFAVIIVVNCEKSWEAMLKCFVFFLISQPLVFLVQILFSHMTFETGFMYFKSWLPKILMTLPGGFIAYFCKKQNILGGIILGLGNTILAVMGVYYFGMVIMHFPRHLLSGIVCVGAVFVMSIYIQKEKRNRLIALLLPVGMTVVVLLLARAFGRVLF